MSITLIIMLISFIILVFLGVPIAFSIAIADILAILSKGNLPLTLFPQRFYGSIDSFSLLAIPLFIIAGDLMVYGGISKRLIGFANILLGWSKYSLSYVTIAASAFFAAISGSAPATNAAIGGMMYKEMVAKNYDPDFSAFLGAIAGTLGPLIPPSIPLVVFATQTGVSVGKLFIAAAVAGALLAIVYAVTARFTLRKYPNLRPTAEKPTLAKAWIGFKEGVWGLISPLIILGGIYSGLFTATECAVIAVVYSIIVGCFIYKELTIKVMIRSFVNSALTSGMVLILVAAASLFSWMLSVEGAAKALSGLVLNFHLSGTLFLLIVTIIYLVLGCFVETIPIIVLTVPIFFPIATSLGINPVHFGILTVFNLVFGIITPPFGVNLFVSAGYSKRGVLEMCWAGRYFFFAGIVMILLYTYVPGIYMWAI